MADHEHRPSLTPPCPACQRKWIQKQIDEKRARRKWGAFGSLLKRLFGGQREPDTDR